MKHLIRKQVITLQLDAGQDAFLIQQRARDYYYLHIAPVLEKLFDLLSSENEIVHIEKMEIDLGDLGWKNDRFTIDNDSIYRVIKNSLSETLSARPDAVVRYRTPEENTCLQWLSYMENGVLPWQTQTADAKWLQQIIHQLAIDHVLIHKTRKLIIENPWFLARLIREHQEIFLQELTEVITAKRQPDLTEMIRQIISDPNKTTLTKNRIWENVLTHFASGQTEIDQEKILLKESKVISKPAISLDKQRNPEELFCQYAGLLLIHPFFTHLFKHLLLLVDGIFRNNASREKAVLLLYFIATGKTDAKDYELVVPKVLCGMHLHVVISEESFFLTEAEQAEAVNMMHAAIEQWSIIHNTSPGALRESFLAREGKLLMNDNGIEFKVESTAIDVLLDHLPWNLSLIKFPWLDKLIRVEWR